MKVGLISASDWANFQWGLTKSLESVGVETISYKLERHPFGYTEQCPIITVQNIKETYKDCDVVLVVHSCWELLQYLPELKCIPVHTGTAYRQWFELINEKFKNSPFSIIALPEFQKLAPNYKYLVGAVECELPQKELGDRLVIGHFPSNPDVKGSNAILRIVEDLKRFNDFDFIWSYDRVSHEESLNRINKCDIYIELLASEQGGKPYGSFGITGLEAAALGKIVITQSINDDGLYNHEYGVNMMNLISNEEDLRKTLNTLLNYKGDFITGQQALTKTWIKENHSYKATGERLLKWITKKD